jgi:hypothetical protein
MANIYGMAMMVSDLSCLQASIKPLRFPAETEKEALYFAKTYGGWTPESDVSAWNTESMKVDFQAYRHGADMVCERLALLDVHNTASQLGMCQQLRRAFTTG